MAVAEAKAASAEQAQVADPRVVELVQAMVAPSGDAKGKDDLKHLAEEISKLIEAAQKKAGGGGPDSVPYAKGPWPPQDPKEAEARFFAGEVFGAEARKAEEEAQKKQAEALQAAYRAAGQQAPAAGSPEAKAAAGQQGYSVSKG